MLLVENQHGRTAIKSSVVAIIMLMLLWCDRRIILSSLTTYRLRLLSRYNLLVNIRKSLNINNYDSLCTTKPSSILSLIIITVRCWLVVVNRGPPFTVYLVCYLQTTLQRQLTRHNFLIFLIFIILASDFSVHNFIIEGWTHEESSV